MIVGRIISFAVLVPLLLSACGGAAEPTPTMVGGAESPSIENASPGDRVSRAEFAVFLLKAKYGESHQPLPAIGGFFSDIADHWAEPWIEQLAVEGISSGNPDGSFHPDDVATRAEAAVLLLRTKHGSDYFPPPGAGGAFNDVSGHWAEDWIEQLKAEGISSGFLDGSYRPDAPLSVADLQVLLDATFQ